MSAITVQVDSVRKDVVVPAVVVVVPAVVVVPGWRRGETFDSSMDEHNGVLLDCSLRSEAHARWFRQRVHVPGISNFNEAGRLRHVQLF